MTRKIFIEIEGTVKDQDGEPIRDIIEILNVLSDSYELYAFSVERESRRLEFEQFLIDAEVPVEELYLRAENDYSKAHDLRLSFVLDHFDGDEDKASELAIVVSNSERAAEAFRELGIRTILVDWGI